MLQERLTSDLSAVPQMALAPEGKAGRTVEVCSQRPPVCGVASHMWLSSEAERVMQLVLTPSPQGTPLKYDTGSSSTSSKKHDVRSIIGSPGRTFPPVHPLDVMADARALERACYEESLKGRPGVVSGSGGSITRGAPVIVPELGKPRQSPLTYEDHGAPFTGHLPRGSPVTTREPTPRLQEGSLSSSKASQDRKLTSTPREVAKSPHSAVPDHHPHPISPYEHLLRGVSGVDLYRGHIPLAFDPTSIPRGIPLDAGDCQGPTARSSGLGFLGVTQGLFTHQRGSTIWGNRRRAGETQRYNHVN